MKEPVFFKPENQRRSPVRVTIYIERSLYERAEDFAKKIGLGGIEKLIVKLLEEVV